MQIAEYLLESKACSRSANVEATASSGHARPFAEKVAGETNKASAASNRETIDAESGATLAVGARVTEDDAVHWWSASD